MKKIYYLIIILLIIFFFPKPYQSSGGYSLPRNDGRYVVDKTTRACLGYSYKSADSRLIPDAPQKSFCLGWVIPKIQK